MTSGVTKEEYRGYLIEEYVLNKEPFYLPVADEVEIFHAAYEERIPLLFKGPTGCGKTRFVEYMAYQLGQPLTVVKPNDKKAKAASSNGASQPAPGHRRLPRRPHRQRPGGPLLAGRRPHRVGRWTPQPRREIGRHLLPGRGG